MKFVLESFGILIDKIVKIEVFNELISIKIESLLVVKLYKDFKISG